MAVQLSAPPRAPRRVVFDPERTKPCIPLYKVIGPEHHRLRVVSPELYSCWVHQTGRRSVPCTGERDAECVHHRLPLRQHHYLFVEVPDNPLLRLLRLSPRFPHEVLPELIESGRRLNGVMLEVWREFGNKPDSRMLGVIVEKEFIDDYVRETPDIEWAVTRMLCADDRNAPWKMRYQQAPPPAPPRESAGSMFEAMKAMPGYEEWKRQFDAKLITMGFMTWSLEQESKRREIARLGDALPNLVGAGATNSEGSSNAANVR